MQNPENHVWSSFVSEASKILQVPMEKLSLPKGDASGGADLSSSVAFEIARERKIPPFRAADEILSSLDLSKAVLIERIENKGGYLNVFAKKGIVLKQAISQALLAGESYGKSRTLSGNALVEFPSVNPNKPWHIGHVRNACLGDTLSRVLEGAGYSVRKLDYIDDLGLQVAKVYWGTRNLPDFPRTENKFDQHLGLLYVQVEKESARTEVDQEIRKIMKEMEEKTAPTGPSARALAEECVRAQYQTAYRFGVFHNLLIFESEIVSSGLFAKALEKMLSTGAVYRATEGEKKDCIVCDVSTIPGFENLEDKEVVLVRSDGTATYTAKDVAFQMWKFGLFENPFHFADFESQPNGVLAEKSVPSGKEIDLGKSELVINVIGAEQAHPQRIVYSLLGRLGFTDQEKKSFHLSYEHVWLPEGKFSGRKGTWVGFSADNVLDEARERALAEVEKKSPDLPSEEKEKIAEAVGVGAVRYTMLKYAPEKKITFKWDDALSFDGDSAPYLQYALARCSRILEKAGKTDFSIELEDADLGNIEEEEFLLAKQVAVLPTEIVRVASSLKKEHWGTRTEISRISEYAFQLATILSKFYVKCRVIGSPEEKRRLALVKASQIALKSALYFLGIPAIERM